MDDQKLRIYNAIASFVQDLNTGFGKKYKPVALYNRLIERTTLRDIEAIDRHIKAFQKFFDINTSYIKTKQFGLSACINYSDRIYLDLGKIMLKTDKNTHEYVHKHLITIYTLMNLNNEKGKEALETLKQTNAETKNDSLELNLPNTNEGNFIKDTLTEMTEQFENLGDNANPMQMMTSMMQSGFFTKFMGDLQTKMSSGEMNLQSLMGTVTNVITEVAPQDGPESDQFKTLINQSIGQLNGLSGNNQMPIDIQSLMNSLGGLNTNDETNDANDETNDANDANDANDETNK